MNTSSASSTRSRPAMDEWEQDHETRERRYHRRGQYCCDESILVAGFRSRREMEAIRESHKRRVRSAS